MMHYMSKPVVTDISSLIAEYESGASARELAVKYDASTSTITGTLKRAGVQLRSLSDTAKLKFTKYPHPSLGRKHSEETRKKMRENHADFKGANHPGYKGKGQYAEDGAYLSMDGNGYLRRRVPSHPLASSDGLIGEHVFQACLIWGTDAVRGNDVHHVDKNKANNSWENLELLTRSQHTRYHNLKG